MLLKNAALAILTLPQSDLSFWLHSGFSPHPVTLSNSPFVNDLPLRPTPSSLLLKPPPMLRLGARLEEQVSDYSQITNVARQRTLTAGSDNVGRPIFNPISELPSRTGKGGHLQRTTPVRGYNSLEIPACEGSGREKRTADSGGNQLWLARPSSLGKWQAPNRRSEEHRVWAHLEIFA